MLRAVLLAVFLAFLTAPALRAEDEPASPVATIPHGDFLAALEALQEGVGRFVPAPPEPGLYDKHEETWKRYAKPRARRMAGRVTILRKQRLWVIAESPEAPAVALAEHAWSALVKGLGSLYTELGTMRARYREQRVSASQARRAWLRRFPRPEPIGRVPSRDALDELNRTILGYRLAGEVVPYRLISAHNRVSDQVAREEEAAREQKRREYESHKHEAYALIDVQVAETNAALRGDVEWLDAQQRAVRELVAAAQAIEEARLRDLVAKAPKEGDHLADADVWFAKMDAGRRAALTFRDPRSARWGSLVRQGWMAWRAKVLSAVDKAVKAAAQAAKDAGG